MGNKKSRDKLYFIIVVNTLDTPRFIKFTISGKKQIIIENKTNEIKLNIKYETTVLVFLHSFLITLCSTLKIDEIKINNPNVTTKYNTY